MKIVCISDIHGYLPEDLPDGDCLVIAGDITPATNHEVRYQAHWLEDRFNLWLDFLPYKHKVVIAGNHDWVFDTHPEMVPKLNCHYLQNSSVTLDGIKFYGYPETPIFFSWAFNQPHERLVEIASKIPDDTDCLVTHGPPYGILDEITDPRLGDIGNPLGCRALRERIDQLPNLKLAVWGHIHSGHGIEKRDKTTFVNASYVNEQYNPDYSVNVVEV